MADETNAAQTEKTNIFLRIVKAVLPWKGDSAKEILRKTVMIISFCVAIVCVILLLSSYIAEVNDQNLNNQLQEQHNQSIIDGSVSLNDDNNEQDDDSPREILAEYKDLYAQNNEMVGWVSIPGTAIDYPVCQAEDNTKYLKLSFDGKYSANGTIFADYAKKITEASQPNNIILYGHNIMYGTYFATLTRYYCAIYGNLDYYKANPLVQFDTLYEKGTYKIFGGCFVNTKKTHGEVFDYINDLNFKNKKDFYTFVENIYDRTQFFTDVDIEYGDEFLTLSTCYFNPFGADAETRFVVFARKVRDGESTDVDVNKATINTNPLYFDYYYNTLGGKWNGRQWDASLITGYSEWLAER